MDANFISWLVGQAGIGGLAALALYLLDRSYKDALRREKEMTEQTREDRRMLLQVLSENAKSNSALQNAIENMTRDWNRSNRSSGRSSGQ